jgi:AcrR family transcriptional regulator
MVDTVYAQRPPTATRLLDAARAMLGEQGLDGLTLREIARRAEVSHGAPRRHFPTLAALLSAVAADGFRGLVAAVDRAVDAAGPDAGAPARLAAAGRGYVHFAVANPGVFSVMFRPERVHCDDPDYAASSHASFAQLAGLVGAAQAEGFHPAADTTQLASIVWTTVHGLAVLWIDGGGSLPGAGRGAGLDHFLALSQSIVLGPAAAVAPSPEGTDP